MVINKIKIQNIRNVVFFILLISIICSLGIFIPDVQNLLISLGERVIGRSLNHDFWHIQFVQMEIILVGIFGTILFSGVYFNHINLELFGNDKKNTVISLCIIIIFSSILLFVPGINLGHDAPFHLMRIEGIADELRRGHIPVRLQSLWLGGYGYPVSIYYGDIFLYFPAILRLTGIPLGITYKIYILTINILTTVIAFVCFKKIFNSTKIGLLLSLIYSTAPYRLVDIYIRSAVGEYSAILFLPIIALSFYEIYDDSLNSYNLFKTATQLAIGMSGLILTHILSTEIVVFSLIIISCILWKKTFTKRTILCIFTAILETVFICSYFLIPFFDYLINVSVNVSQLYIKQIQKSGVYLIQFFMFFQNPFGYDVPEIQGRMLFSPGLPLMICFLIYAFNFYKIKKNHKNDKQLNFLFILAIIFMWFSSNLFPWDKLSYTLPGRYLSQIQFPFRFLVIVMIILTLLNGRFIIYQNYSPRIITKILICLVIIQTTVFYFQYQRYLINNKINDYTSLQANVVGLGEYIRLGSDINNLDGKIEVENVSINNIYRNSNNFVFNVTSQDSGFVELPIFNYKGYQAVSNNNEKLTICDGNNNVVRIMIPSNFDGEVVVQFKQPLLWNISLFISLCTIIIILIILFKKGKKI